MIFDYAISLLSPHCASFLLMLMPLSFSPLRFIIADAFRWCWCHLLLICRTCHHFHIFADAIDDIAALFSPPLRLHYWVISLMLIRQFIIIIYYFHIITPLHYFAAMRHYFIIFRHIDYFMLCCLPFHCIDAITPIYFSPYFIIIAIISLLRHCRFHIFADIIDVDAFISSSSSRYFFSDDAAIAAAEPLFISWLLSSFSIIFDYFHACLIDIDIAADAMPSLFSLCHFRHCRLLSYFISFFAFADYAMTFSPFRWLFRHDWCFLLHAISPLLFHFCWRLRLRFSRLFLLLIAVSRRYYTPCRRYATPLFWYCRYAYAYLFAARRLFSAIDVIFMLLLIFAIMMPPLMPFLRYAAADVFITYRCWLFFAISIRLFFADIFIFFDAADFSVFRCRRRRWCLPLPMLIFALSLFSHAIIDCFDISMRHAFFIFRFDAVLIIFAHFSSFIDAADVDHWWALLRHDADAMMPDFMLTLLLPKTPISPLYYFFVDIIIARYFIADTLPLSIILRLRLFSAAIFIDAD